MGYRSEYVKAFELKKDESSVTVVGDIKHHAVLRRKSAVGVSS